jgi:hypothetical protein
LTFNSDTIAITQESKNTLKKLSKSLIKFPDKKIEIVGYADEHECEKHTNNLNIQCIERCNYISMKRASFIKDMLIKEGVSSEQLITTGKGCSTQTNEVQKDSSKVNPHNQRIEIIHAEPIRIAKEQENSINDSIKIIDSTKVNHSDKTLTSNNAIHKDEAKNKLPTSESKPYLKTQKNRIGILLIVLLIFIVRKLSLNKKEK